MQNKTRVIVLNEATNFNKSFNINNQIIYSPEQVDVNDSIQLKVARGKIATKVVHRKGRDD